MEGWIDEDRARRKQSSQRRLWSLPSDRDIPDNRQNLEAKVLRAHIAGHGPSHSLTTTGCGRCPDRRPSPSGGSNLSSTEASRIRDLFITVSRISEVRQSTNWAMERFYRASPTKTVKTSISKKKLMPNRALNNIQLPGRAPTKAFSPFKTKLFPKRYQENNRQPE